jgi:hypothetical protein
MALSDKNHATPVPQLVKHGETTKILFLVLPKQHLNLSSISLFDLSH